MLARAQIDRADVAQRHGFAVEVAACTSERERLVVVVQRLLILAQHSGDQAYLVNRLSLLSEVFEFSPNGTRLFILLDRLPQRFPRPFPTQDLSLGVCPLGNDMAAIPRRGRSPFFN